MCKKLIYSTALVLVFICCILCCQATISIERDELYAQTISQLQQYMYDNDSDPDSLKIIMDNFTELGYYAESTSFLFYTNVLYFIEISDFEAASKYMATLIENENFNEYLVNNPNLGFGTLDLLEAYMHGRQCEYNGDLYNAYNYYDLSDGYIDSMPRMLNVRSLLASVPTPTPTPTPKPEPTPMPLTVEKGFLQDGYQTIPNNEVSTFASSVESGAGYGPYYAEYANDSDCMTEWIEGKDGNGNNEKLTFRFSEQTIKGFIIRAGMWRSNKSYWQNTRPAKIHIYIDDHPAFEYVLEDRMNEQVILFSYPVTTSSLTIELVTFYNSGVDPRYGYHTCISDVWILTDY